MSIQVIVETPLGLMQTAGWREGYPGIGRVEIDIVWRSAKELASRHILCYGEDEMDAHPATQNS